MRKAFDLRPLDFNDILSRSFSLFTANFVGLLRWFLIAWLLPVLAVAILFYFALEPYQWAGRPGHDPSMFEFSNYAAYVWLVKLASVSLAFSIGAAGIYYLGARLYVGDRPGLREVMQAVQERLNHMAGAAFLHVLAFVAITFFCLVPPVILGRSGEIGWALLWGLFGWCGYIPIAMWYFGRFGLNVASTMLDDAEAMESFARSSYLTKKFRMRFAGVMITAVLVVGLPGVPGLLTIPALLGEELLADKGLPLLGVLLRLGWDAVLLPLFFLPPVVFYFDMRCRKEGYDLTVMARNFGIAEGEMQRYRFNPDLGYVPRGWKGPIVRGSKPVRRPQQRSAGARMAQKGLKPAATPWGPQPGMPGAFPGGGPQAPQQAPPQGQWQGPGQQGPPQQQPPTNPAAPPLPNWDPSRRRP